MRVGIYYVGGSANTEENIVHAYLGSLAADVAKHTMPGVEVCHLTDTKAIPIQGVDKVIRMERDCPMAVFRMRHHQAPGDWLFIDSDVLIVEDVQGVFRNKKFDVAVAERIHGDGMTGAALKQMPYNMGVTFSRCPDFWAAAEKELLRYEPKLQEWMGDQLAVCSLIKRGAFDVRELLGTFNYPPRSPNARAAHILHFKGARKQWMRQVAEDILRETA